jgi:hypothetical protein
MSQLTIVPFTARLGRLGAGLLTLLLLTAFAAAPAQAVQSPPCLVGTWRTTDFDAFIRATAPELPSGSANFVSGEAITTVRPDGSYENAYRQLTLGAKVGEMTMTMSFDGLEKGTVRESAPGELTITTTEGSFTMTASAEGTSQTVDMTMPGPSVQVIQYECTPSQATYYYNIPMPDGSTSRIRGVDVRVN